MAETLIHEMEPKLVHMLRTWTKDQSTIEEIILETWKDMAAHMDTLERHPNPCGWIMNAAKFNAYHELEKKKKKTEREVALEAAINVRIEQIWEDEQQQFDNLNRWLSEKEIELLKYYYLYGVGYKEMSAYYHMTVASCRQCVSRAVRKLRKHKDELLKWL